MARHRILTGAETTNPTTTNIIKLVEFANSGVKILSSVDQYGNPVSAGTGIVTLGVDMPWIISQLPSPYTFAEGLHLDGTTAKLGGDLNNDVFFNNPNPFAPSFFQNKDVFPIYDGYNFQPNIRLRRSNNGTRTTAHQYLGVISAAPFTETYFDKASAAIIFQAEEDAYYDHKGASIKFKVTEVGHNEMVTTMKLKDNLDIWLGGYDSGRDDGNTGNALYVDADGNVKHGPIVLSVNNNYIQNITSGTQSASFNINGTGTATNFKSNFYKSATGNSYMRQGRASDTYFNFHFGSDRNINLSVISNTAYLQALGENGSYWDDFVISARNSTGTQPNILFSFGNSATHKFSNAGNVILGSLTDDGSNRLQITGNAKISGLAGTGTRMVVADANGVLSTQAIPSSGSTTAWETTGNTVGASGKLLGTLDNYDWKMVRNSVRMWTSTNTLMTFGDTYANSGRIDQYKFIYMGSSGYGARGFQLYDDYNGFNVVLQAIAGNSLYITNNSGAAVPLTLGTWSNPADATTFTAGSGNWSISSGNFNVNAGAIKATGTATAGNWDTLLDLQMSSAVLSSYGHIVMNLGNLSDYNGAQWVFNYNGYGNTTNYMSFNITYHNDLLKIGANYIGSAIYTGTGNRLNYWDASGNMVRSSIDPANILVQGYNSLATDLEFDATSSQNFSVSANTINLTGDLRLDGIGVGDSPDSLLGYASMNDKSVSAVQLGSGLSLESNTMKAKHYLLNSQYTDAANSGTSETDLMSYTIPANQFATNGDVIDYTMVFKAAINSNSKTLNFYVGGSSVLGYNLVGAAGGDVYVTGQLIRIDSTHVRYTINIRPFNGTPVILSADLNRALNSSMVFKTTATCGASNDYTQKTMTLSYTAA